MWWRIILALCLALAATTIALAQFKDPTDIQFKGFTDIVEQPAAPVSLCERDPLGCGIKEMPSVFCEVDPDACSFGGGKKEFSPSPVCEIDPCACKSCKEHLPGALGFESAVETIQGISIEPSRIGVDLLSGRLQEPHFESPLSSESQADVTSGSASFRLETERGRDELTQAVPNKLLCNNALSRPTEYWRELLLRKSESQRCSDAAQIMIEQREKHQLAYFNILAGITRKQDARTAFKVFEDYRDACIHGVDDLSDTAAVRYSFGGDFLRMVAENVGELNFEGRHVNCTATIVQTEFDGQPRIGLATAAHCIGDPVKGTSSATLQFATIHTNMTFVSLSGKSYPVEIDGGLRGFVYDRQRDSVIIPNAVAANERLPNLGFKVANALDLSLDLWQPLYVVGVNPFLAALKNLTAESGVGGLSSASISLEPGCRVYGISGLRVYHNCQTERGMSGSPVFVSTAGGVRIVAVHSGEADSPTIDACPRPTAGAANYATLLPIE